MYLCLVGSVLELDRMVRADAVFSHGQFIWLFQSNVLV
jgi:hypothetical protein